MTVTEEEKRRILEEDAAKRKRELSERMRKLGKTRSPAKMAAARKNLEKAWEKKFGRKIRSSAGPRKK